MAALAWRNARARRSRGRLGGAAGHRYEISFEHALGDAVNRGFLGAKAVVAMKIRTDGGEGGESEAGYALRCSGDRAEDD